MAQKARWSVEHEGPWNGGLLATGGGLVFQGTAGSEFNAYDAGSGRKLWSFAAETGVVAPPITYTVNGEQYVAVLAGWGGAYALSVDGDIIKRKAPVRNVSRLLVFKLGGTAKLPPPPALVELPLDPPLSTAKPELIALGQAKYGRYCAVCHAPGAVGSTVLPDLRRAGSLESAQAWNAVVEGGALKDNGMASFKGSLSKDEIEAIRAYVVTEAERRAAEEN